MPCYKPEVRTTTRRGSDQMKLLIIGGTQFLGRHLTTAALEGNHEVTLFNRGNHPSMANVETIVGDRNRDLHKLRGRHWDAVVDTCGFLPDNVRAVAEASDSVERYVFISSVSAYADFSVVGVDEAAPLKSLNSDQLAEANAIDSSGPSSAVNYGKLYGGLKALCEAAAEEVMPGRVLNIRPGLIVGPDDYTDRFTYWVVRTAGGGEVLAPARPECPVQFIDVRDLAEWIVRMLERKATGVYNANGLPGVTTMASLLESCNETSGDKASFTWVSEEFLLAEPVWAWTEMPLWMPEEAAPHMKGFMLINCDKAVAAGLTYRPLSETIEDTLSWWETNCSGEKMKAGIDREREQRLLEKWHAEN